MNTLHLNPSQVPVAMRVGYGGRTFKATITESVTLTNITWSGGTRSVYTLYNMITNGASSILNKDGATIAVQSGYAVIEHSIFCGKDMGLTFYIHPDNATTFLPVQDGTLGDSRARQLIATAHLKNSYGGQTNIRFTAANRVWGIDTDRWRSDRDYLIGNGYLRKNGSITTKGRNAVANHPDRHANL